MNIRIALRRLALAGSALTYGFIALVTAALILQAGPLIAKRFVPQTCT